MRSGTRSGSLQFAYNNVFEDEEIMTGMGTGMGMGIGMGMGMGMGMNLSIRYGPVPGVKHNHLEIGLRRSRSDRKR